MFLRVPLRLGVLIVLLTLFGGAVSAPLLLPLVQSGPVYAQSMPWTPTAEPTEAPTHTPVPTHAPSPTHTLSPTSTAVPASPPTSTATSAPTALPPGYAPDSCEPNNTLVQPCAMPTEVDVTELNFVDRTMDVYSMLLKANRLYTVRASSAHGIDPVLSVYLASDLSKPLAQNDDIAAGSGDAQVELATTAEAWYVIQVENKAPGDMKGRLYSLSVRSATPQDLPGGKPGPTPTPAQLVPGDMLENNYDPGHASRLSWGVPYDLSLVCPDPDPSACGGGDHDFLIVPVKQGVPFVAMTYDLGPGTDTFVSLYRPDAAQRMADDGKLQGWRLINTNDDVTAGWTLRSAVTVVPDWTGDVLLVVATLERTNPPLLPEAAGPPGRYRLIVGSAELEPVKRVLDRQHDLPPTPVPTLPPPVSVTAEPPAIEPPGLPPAPQPTELPPAPTSAPLPAAISTAPAADQREVVKESSVKGLAVVSKNGTRLYGAAPPADGDELASYPEGALVTLIGQSYRGWVKVQPQDSVTPGWMWVPALRPVEIDDPAADARPTGTPAASETTVADTLGTAQPNGNPQAMVTSTAEPESEHT